MSTTVPQTNPTRTRYPLGLPAGSVRSVLTLTVVGMVCVMMLLATPEKAQPIPPFLIYLLFLIIGSFFSAHGNSIGGEPDEPNPFNLPSGTIRIIILAAIIGTVAYKLTNDPDSLTNQIIKTMDKVKDEPLLPLVILGGFFAGVVFHALLGRHLIQYTAYQDILAWVAIIAQVLMAISILFIGVVNPSLSAGHELDLANFEAICGAVVAFYFAARS